jgi:beta-galactosidase
MSSAKCPKSTRHTAFTLTAPFASRHHVRGLASFAEIANPRIAPVAWRRFSSGRIIDFFLAESAPLRERTPEVPVTTNFTGLPPSLDYVEFARHVDFACWDSYPYWHSPDRGDATAASEVAFVHDLYRGLKGGRPWILMESQPALSKGKGVLPLKRPGLHVTSSLQAVAHGADGVMYFQWRKGRGGEEKFHGAVVDHVGHERTRAFREVAEVGRVLAKLDDVVGATTPAEVALLHDWRCRWALEWEGYLGEAMHRYLETCMEHHRPFWSLGVPVDVIGFTAPLEGYRLVCAPLLYMLHDGIDEKLAAFVERGGALVATYGCGMVDEHDRALRGGFPGGRLREVLGVWNEEQDGRYPGETVPVVMAEVNGLGLSGTYEARDVCAVLHAESAEALASYGGEFYAGTPAVTVNRFGEGEAYYLASRNGQRFLSDLYGALAKRLGLRRVIEAELPEGATAQLRTDGEREFVFLLNFAPDERRVGLGGAEFVDLVTGEELAREVTLAGYGSRVLERR